MVNQRYFEYLWLGNELFKFKDYKNAILFYENAIDVNLNNRHIWIDRGSILIWNVGNELFELKDY